MDLKDGIYEQIINNLFAEQIDLVETTKLMHKRKMGDSESSEILAQYLHNIIREKLNQLGNSDEKIQKKIKISNQIIQLLTNQEGEGVQAQKLLQGQHALEKLITEDAEILLTILEKINSRENDLILRPKTSISRNYLFTGSDSDPSLASELKKEIMTADSVEILVSFIRWSGISLIMKELEQFTQNPNHSLRIITTVYTQATELKAIDFLASLPNTKIRISYDTKRTRLHAKAYRFYRKTGFSTGYIGSSNISRPAMSSGLEWNLKISEYSSPEIMQKIEATIESYWHSEDFSEYLPDRDRAQLQKVLQKEYTMAQNNEQFNFAIHPYPYQAEILEKLQSERILHDRWRNLVVAATGTGKTIISAFDYKEFSEQNPNQPNKLLFVAHRQEILKQSRACFRGILQDENFGELWVGKYKPNAGEIGHLFVSIQTFNAKVLEEETAKDFYDFIIVDEFHHSAAPSYQKLLSYYTPKILLGLTATPERMDGKSVVDDYFAGKIAAEIRLPEAINRKLLSPFLYFGVTDNVDLNQVQWKRGGYDRSELEQLYIGNLRRMQLIFNSVEKYLNNIDEIIGLGFCVSVEHAKYMAEKFTEHGIPSIALTGKSKQEERETAQNRLSRKEIHFIFCVDIYNEGIDIPKVNTVLFLRPTESLTIFIQQLGRGLRLSEGKDCLTVLDFIGQANRSYSFERKLRVLIGRTKQSVKNEIEEGFSELPKGCFIELEKVAQEYILANIQSAVMNRRNIVQKIASFTRDTDQPLSLTNFCHFYNITLNEIYKRDSWNRLCVNAKVRDEFSNPDEKTLVKGIQRLETINSGRAIKFFINLLENLEDFNEENLTVEEKLLVTIFHYTMWVNSLTDLQFSSVSQSLLKIKENPELLEEILEVLKFNFEAIDFIDQKIELGFPCPLDLHCQYTTDQILAALGKYSLEHKPRFSEGVLFLKEKNVDLLFITLNKSEREYSPSTMYNDYSINEILFHWQSQSTTSVTSPTGLRYLTPGHNILIFVRNYKKINGKTAPYCYLGPVKYVKHDGTRPINIVWQLTKPIPAFLLKDSNKFSI